jgi:hypothetical protein
MSKLQHPFKAEVQAVREIIKGVARRLLIRLNGMRPAQLPDYMAAFNLHAKQHVHLVWHTARCCRTRAGCLRVTIRTGA